MNVQLPDINLSGLLPVAGLAVIAVACIAALLLRSVLHSRVALLIAVVGGIVIAGPTLTFGMAQIVGALAPLAIVALIAGVSGLWLVQRNPTLLGIARDLVPPRGTPAQPPPPEQGSGIVVIDQPKATPARLPARRVTIVDPDKDNWGF
jgi:hypothetical protein